MTIFLAEAKPGMTLPTIAGNGTIRTVTRTTPGGRDRLTITFSNGIVATNLHPTDKVQARP